MPSLGYRVSGKEVEVHDSGSRHHQRCGCCNLQLIQSHVAPSHGPPASVLSPLSLWLQSLSCYLSHVAKRSTPKLRGPLYSPSEPRGPFPHFRAAWSTPSFRAAWSPPHLLWSRVVSSLSQNLVILPTTMEPRGLLFLSEPHGLLPIYFGATWSPLTLWLPGLGLNPSAHLPLQPHF